MQQCVSTLSLSLIRSLVAQVQVNGVDIDYEISGSGEPLLLIMGLGGQLTDWPQEFVDRLAQHFQVIRYDNRDSGLSSYSTVPAPTRWELLKGNLHPGSIEPPYRLRDMANDALGLLHALDLDDAHIVGMSMGGMIAQLIAAGSPTSTRSLCSIMSNTGDRRTGRPTPGVVASIARRGQPSRSEALDVTIELFRRVGGRDWDEHEQRVRSAISLDRAYNPAGVLRQSQAITASPDRTQALRQVTAPTLIVHGLEDTLVRPSGGVATAAAIPHSRLIMFPRMGHNLPRSRDHELITAIRTNAARANAARSRPS